MKRYMLDTNTVSYLLKGHPAVVRRVVETPMSALCISAITEGELLFGLVKRPEAKRLQVAVQEFLRRVDVLPWNSAIADFYSISRVDLEKQGKTLAPLDLLIASHALGTDAVLVSSDKAFSQLATLNIEDWAS
ncbi:MAG: type II toxin-antitoxin system VapC family toxin [Proteobacteria bacterium]|nr:MAG: type II toxin-antitoxin system VapC family toxin [Pseudomonadota bacterium]